MEKHPKRLVVYLDEKDYTRLRMLLLSKGKNVSAWLREIVLKYINSDKGRF